MRRYTVIRPRGYSADLWDIPIEPLNVTVFEREPEQREVGLMDHMGRTLYVCEERNPIGFRAKFED